MALCVFCVLIAVAAGAAAGLRCRVWALLPLAGAIIVLSLVGWSASISPAASTAPCAIALVALQCGFLAGAALGAGRAAQIG